MRRSARETKKTELFSFPVERKTVEDSDNEDEMETESVNEEPMPRKKAKANYDAISEASSSGGLIGEYEIILSYS